MQRKYTISVFRFHAARLLRNPSSTQIVIPLWMGEPELDAFVKRLLYRDWFEGYLIISIDSSAAKSISTWRGASRQRHIQTSTLWVQRKSQHTGGAAQRRATCGSRDEPLETRQHHYLVMHPSTLATETIALPSDLDECGPMQYGV